MFTRITLSAAVLCLAAGAAQAQAYMCPGFGDVDVRITLIEGTDAAVAEFIAGIDNPSEGSDPVTMRAQRGGDGITYAGGELMLRGSGDLAELTDGDITIQCTLEGAAPPEAPVEQPAEIIEEEVPVADIEEEVPAAEVVAEDPGEATPDAAGGANISAISLGGNLRDGPGTEFADIGGLDEGTEITLQTDTGVAFNGYTWWEIILPNGDLAFQWGGVICAPGGGVAGVIQDPGACPAVEAVSGETAADASGTTGISAISRGGNLRSGPGTAFPDIGGLEDGTAITLLNDSGIPFNGYNWWEIELADGQVVFQWGGVICVPTGGVAGVLESCE